MRIYNNDVTETVDYRKNEIHPDLYSVMDEARYERNMPVPTYAIDKAIRLQNERSVLTACNFIRYFLLHQLSYVDVFGQQAVEYDRQLEHFKQCENLELKVDILTDMVNDMSVKMSDMQRIIFNLANMMKRSA